MKPLARKRSARMLHHIETLEEEIFDLKLSVLKELRPSKTHLMRIKGLLKGVEIPEEEIEASQKSLYGKIAI